MPAGATDDGFCVIEWWDSEGSWDTSLVSGCNRRSEKSVTFLNPK